MIAAHAIGDALRAALEEDCRVILLGEDLVDPYGGAFKVTRGLSTDFPGRVRSTPISEGAIAGLSAGLALSGYRPITEIMFGDFLTLCFDQIVNHIAKYEAMYNGKVTCPVIIRRPRAAAAAMAQRTARALKSTFSACRTCASWPARSSMTLRRIARAAGAGQPGAAYRTQAALSAAPDAARRRADRGRHRGGARFTDGLPTVLIRPVPREDCSFTVLAYGYQAELARRVLSRLAVEEEIFGELVVPSRISPLDWEPIDASVGVTRRLLVIEEGVDGFTWGSEVAARISSRFFGELRRPVATAASDPTVIPSSKALEAEMLMTPERVEQAIRKAAA